VQLIQDDWDVLTAHYGEGKLLLRSLRTSGAKPKRYILTVIADGTLNVAFLGVALRVAASKLIAELESAPPVPAGSTTMAAMSGSQVGAANNGSLASGTATPLRASSMVEPQPQIARSGLSWSGVSSGSGVGNSDVGVVDAASVNFLSACTKALAASIGPMAKVFVKEAVRKVCGERPFSRTDGPALLAHLASTIEDNDDRAMFQRATRSL
jgi:hypothetical protein